MRLLADRLKRSIVVTAVALVAVVVGVLAQAFPSSEAVRLRNALLLIDADVGDFNWRPDQPPAGFLQESQPVPPLIAARAKEIAGGTDGGDVEVAKALVSHLVEHARDGGDIQSLDPERTYRAIVEDGHGFCADFIDTFIALALAVDIPVRAWAFSFDGFGGQGHVVAEIFDREQDRWVMLDVFNNLYPVDRETGATLSALEAREQLIANPSSVRFLAIGPGRIAIPIEAKLFDYYRGGLSEWYLWFGNNVVSRGQHPVTSVAGFVFEPLGELHAIARGAYPHIVPLKASANAEQIRRMKGLKQELLWAAAVAVVLGVALVVQLTWWLARRPRIPPEPSEHANVES